MSAMVDVKDAIRHFILANYLVGERPENLRDDTRLQTSGILDSLATLGLANFIHKTYGVDLTVVDTAAERFDRIEDIAALVARKRSH